MASDSDEFARKVHRALAHPLRVRILEIAGRGDAVSPVDLAGELGEPLGVVSYHVRALATAGLLELAGRSFRRGAVKHHYRATPRLGATVRARMPAARAGELVERIRAAVEEAGADGADGDAELTVVIHRTSGTDAG
jgi:DNA-binding transcriptional ArsR family regulator